MNRAKRLYILLGVLALACLVTFAVSRHEEAKEEIRNSDTLVLEIPYTSVTALAWEYDSQSLSFHKDESWLYDADEAFPVDEEKMQELLEPFAAFGASFIIESVEDYSQYGLDDPICTIDLSTEDTTYQILLGDYSAMDSERYVSIGDGNVYLVQNDPLDQFDAVLSDLIDQDDIPQLNQAEEILFSGASDLQIAYHEEGGNSYREDDVYFLQQDGDSLPLDNGRVKNYLQTISNLDLSDYITYQATEEELQACGLDTPELTIAVTYNVEDEETESVNSETFTLHISRDPEEAQAAAAAAAEAVEETAATDTDTTAEAESEEEITAYARVGTSDILYRISGDEYTALLAASYDDFRHPEVLPADFADITQLDISLDRESYSILSAADTDSDERIFSYREQEVEIADLQAALEALSANSFTAETPQEKEEVGLVLYLDTGNEEEARITIDLYRYDGSNCLAVVDGTPVSLVTRSLVVDLIEAVNAIVLN